MTFQMSVCLFSPLRSVPDIRLQAASVKKQKLPIPAVRLCHYTEIKNVAKID